MRVEKKIVQAHKKLSESVKQCPKTFFIWDTSIFYSFVNEIKYFASLHMITLNDVENLKEELYQLLTYIETLSSKGEFSEGRKVYFYLSNINFEATYSYLETTSMHLSMIRVYAINSITTQDNEMFGDFKEWIQSLKKFSTLISESGEMQRILFFKKQREIINAL